MENDETYRTLCRIDILLEEAVDSMKEMAPGTLAVEIVKIEKTREMLVYVRDLTTCMPSGFNVPVPLASLARKPRTNPVCKNAILEAKQALIDLGMREEDVEHILFALLARNIQIHFPVTPE